MILLNYYRKPRIGGFLLESVRAIHEIRKFPRSFSHALGRAPNPMAAKFSNPGWKSDVDAMPNADADFANYFCTYSFLYHQVPCSSHELAMRSLERVGVSGGCMVTRAVRDQWNLERWYRR